MSSKSQSLRADEEARSETAPQHHGVHLWVSSLQLRLWEMNRLINWKRLGSAMAEDARRAIASRVKSLSWQLLSGMPSRELSELNAAIDRIDNGTWGDCEVCGAAIGRSRLLAIPEARRCEQCKQSE